MNKRQLLLIGLFILVLASRPVRPALAHADLVTASPAPGAILTESPAQVSLTFSESVANGTIDLFEADFSRVAGVEPAEAGAAEGLAANLPELPVGIYTVQWAVVSDDGHSVSGSYAFEVRAPAGGGLATWLYWGIGLAVLGALWLQLRRVRQREDRAYGL
ncbi:MAG: copper resistance protein CopC [Anaerolineales bacterium]|nr:copper resistance protein CopC [Anaerolineales bacterium]